VNLIVSGERCRYAVRKVIYSGGSHFTSRIIKPNGTVWHHDGIETGRKPESERVIHAKDSKFLSTCTREKVTRVAAEWIVDRDNYWSSRAYITPRLPPIYRHFPMIAEK
ncbi:hypothetical protein B0H13DRAFT_1587078, partial [Mycena leptocephala]